MVNNQKYQNLKELYIKKTENSVKFNGSTFKPRNRSITLETINFKVNKNTVKDFIDIPEKYFYLGSHGYIDRTKPKKRINLIRTPKNVSIVYIAPVGMSISEQLNLKSKQFYMSNEMLNQFHKNHYTFLKNKSIPTGLKKCIVIPPGHFYLDHTITFKPRSNLQNWEKKEFGLFKVPYVRRDKKDLLEEYKKYKKNINLALSNGDEKDVFLSSIINTFLKGNKKGGIIFVDTCRIIWTQIKGFKELNRVCRLTGKRHCKSAKNYCSDSEAKTNGRSISIFPKIKMSNSNIETYKRLSLDKLFNYKKFEEKRSNLFKQMLSGTNLNSNIKDYYINVESNKDIKLNHSLNYTKHNNIQEYINHLRSLDKQGTPLSFKQKSFLEGQFIKSLTTQKKTVKATPIQLKTKRKINRRLYKINE